MYDTFQSMTVLLLGDNSLQHQNPVASPFLVNSGVICMNSLKVSQCPCTCLSLVTFEPMDKFPWNLGGASCQC